MKAKVLEVQKAPTDCHGCSGERWVIESPGIPEGYRPGSVVRLFLEGWPIKNRP